MRNYQGENDSKNPELNPQSLDDVKSNMLKHMERDRFEGFKELGSRLIDVGRARDIEGSKHPFEVMGYFYQEFAECFLVGPIVFVSANGYVCEGNDEIDNYEKHSIGNILNEDIKSMVRRGGIEMHFSTPEEFFHFLGERIHNYDTLAGPHYHIIDGKMGEVDLVRDTAYQEELKRFMEFLEDGSLTIRKILEYDFSKYPYDLSLIEHVE